LCRCRFQKGQLSFACAHVDVDCRCCALQIMPAKIFLAGKYPSTASTRPSSPRVVRMSFSCWPTAPTLLLRAPNQNQQSHSCATPVCRPPMSPRCPLLRE
jgi:hypothetical protein